jgi:prepilin-type N-terminal cleavage/methylation domain-containing protein
MASLYFKKHRNGFSLVEMIIYMAILAMMLLVIINTLFIISTSQRTVKSSKTIENSGIFSLERMVRDIRNATSVDTNQSILGSHPGVLVLNGTDVNGNSHVVKFYLSTSTLHVVDNSVDQGALTETGTKVTNLVFTLINTTKSSAVRIQMTLESGTSTYYRSEKFYSTAILRGSI